VARIKDSSVEAVKSALDLVAIVEGRTRLRRQGSSYKGLCPFHAEKTPSFSVLPERGTYHCFGCGEGGDAIDFVRKTEGVDFVGAIEWLADRFTVPLEYEEVDPDAERRRKQRDRLYALLDRAASFYERYLWESDEGAFARDYLRSRGLGEEVCREFRLGLAASGTTLGRRAAAEGFARDEVLEAGLANRRGNDYFQRRLLFPLADARGRIRGFQARQLHDDDPIRGKYVNSPESELFRKGDLLYGLHQSRAAIARQDRAVVVEGNADVLALRQAGFEPVVASMGTALTERQLRELRRLTRRLYLCFDADAAGTEATLRGMELAAAQGFDVDVVTLPPGTDPADDPAGFDARLGKAEDYLPYRVRLEIERARDREDAFRRARAFLAGFENSPERLDAERVAVDLLDLPRGAQLGLAGRGVLADEAGSPRLVDAGVRLERSALAGVAAHPELVRLLAELGPEHFDHDESRQLRAHLLGDAGPAGELTPLLAELHARAEAESIDVETAEQLLLRIRERRLERELAEAADDRLVDLQHTLAQIREAIREFA
jgi:DNA primase catalytic core